VRASAANPSTHGAADIVADVPQTPVGSSLAGV